MQSSIDQYKVINLPETADKIFPYLTKVTRAAAAAKGSVDFAEAVACQDGVCPVVSAIGVSADCLQICTSFIPRPNVTSIVTIIVTMPISVGCKVFVWCCKRSKLPWEGC